MSREERKNRKGARGMFWGIVFLVIGAVILLNVVFGIHLPIFRILFGLFFVSMGVKIMTGGSWGSCSTKHEWSDNLKGRIVFSNGKSSPKDLGELEDREFNVVFGSGELDLTQTQISEGMNSLEVNTVFGESTVKIPASLAIEPEVNSVAGSLSLPPEAEGKSESTKRLKLKLNAVFGSIRVRRQ